MNMAPRICPRILPVLIFALATSTSWAASYRWTDAAGDVHYGDQPPVGVTAERLQAPPPPPLTDDALPFVAAPESATGVAAVTPGTTGQPSAVPPGESGQPEQAAPSEEALKRDQARQAQEARQQADVKRRNCQAARSNLETLQRNKPLRLNDPGSPKSRGRRVSSEEREKMTREAQKQIRENCN